MVLAVVDTRAMKEVSCWNPVVLCGDSPYQSFVRFVLTFSQLSVIAMLAVPTIEESQLTIVAKTVNLTEHVEPTMVAEDVAAVEIANLTDIAVPSEGETIKLLHNTIFLTSTGNLRSKLAMVGVPTKVVRSSMMNKLVKRSQRPTRRKH